MDTVPREKRSWIMSRIRSESGIEILPGEFRGLHMRRHPAGIFGRPDFGNKARRIAVFIDGCFWHGCPEHYREPRSNIGFWRAKMGRNRARGEVMNAMWFNVPQSRERVIIIGVRKDLNIEPNHPKPQGKPIAIKQAFKGIENLKGIYPTVGTKIAECCLNMKPGTTASDFYRKNWGFNLYRLSWNKPSPTFTKGGGACGLIHPQLPRKCIKQEYQAIMSFPQSFVFVGSEDDARARIGDSVPPNLMRTIGEHVRKEILEKIGGKKYE